MRRYMQITYTDDVKAAQEHAGVREVSKRMEQDRPDQALTWQEQLFIRERDHFYMATVNQDGWPYVQYRGGPPGFLKAIGPTTLAYADFRGNRQLISMGNLRSDDRVSLFFMDSANRRRLKILARATVSEDPALLERLADPDYEATVERAVVFELEAFDWNCPQHITPRLTAEEWAPREAIYKERIADLEARVAELEAR